MENKEVKNKKIKHINQILCVINQYCDYMESFDRLLCSKIVILIALYEKDLYLLYLK